MRHATRRYPAERPIPVFRAEQVGSFLRPQYLLDARQRRARGEISYAELRRIEDRAIAGVVAKQESLGFGVVTDGELRRAYFHLDFLEQIEGVTMTGTIPASSDAQHTVGFTPPKITITGKVRHTRGIQVEDYRYLAAQTTRTARVAIPSPTMAHFRGGRDAIDKAAYPVVEEFFADLAQCYRDEIEALYAAGCRYIQLDDTNLAYLCDPKMCSGARERGENPERLPYTYAKLINDAIRNDHADLCIGIHLCRGNYRSAWFAAGSYDPVAEVLFNELDVDTYFLEYDDDRSGGFEPLRFVPKDKVVVLGLVSSKLGELEDADDVVARIGEAARYLPMDQMCVSAQCGFASTHHGNALTEDQQWAKMALIKRIADRVWQD